MVEGCLASRGALGRGARDYGVMGLWAGFDRRGAVFVSPGMHKAAAGPVLARPGRTADERGKRGNAAITCAWGGVEEGPGLRAMAHGGCWAVGLELAHRGPGRGADAHAGRVDRRIANALDLVQSEMGLRGVPSSRKGMGGRGERGVFGMIGSKARVCRPVGMKS